MIDAMDTLFFKPLVFGGFAALALVAVLVLRRQLDVFHCFVRRLSVPERVALVGFLAICIAYGGSKTNSPSMMMARPPARPTVTSDDIARGWQFVGTRTNGNVCYTMPVGATLATNWWVRGAYEDVVKTGLGSWSFPFGTNAYSSLWVFTWGKARFRFDDINEISAVGSPMSAVPYRSRLWTLETNNSFLVTWENFALNRDTNTTISAQLELHRSGDFITRSNAVETAYRRVDPEDWDDDGIPNVGDPHPYSRDGDFFGPRQTLPDEANEGAYCWVEIAADVNTHVVFAGDGESDLPDPDFMLRAGETNRVTLLIGKTYTVESSQPLAVTDRSSAAIEVGGNGSRSLTIVWPVDVYAMEGNGANFMMRVVPDSIGGDFEWTDCCCPITGSGRVFSFSCNAACLCMGCYPDGFLTYEGYSIPVTGGHCGCSYGPHQASTEPDDEQMVTGVSASFSPEAVIFEATYTNRPGSVVYGRSTEAVLSCTVHGGFRGGTATFSFAGETNLVWIRGAAVPQSLVTIPPGEKLEFAAVYEGLRPSEEAEDITYTVTFTENDTTNAPSTVTAKLTSVKVELETKYPAVANSCKQRHLYGVAETVYCHSRPAVDGADWDVRINDLEAVRITGSQDGFYASWTNGIGRATYSACGASYETDFAVLEPEIEVRNPRVNERDVSPVFGEAGHLLLFLDQYVAPDYVSFREIYLMEIPDESNGGPHSGYYDNPLTGSWSHMADNKAGQWCPVSQDGYWGYDASGHPGAYVTPWSEGEKTWEIPVGWGFGGSNVVARLHPNPTRQKFTMHANGTFRIEKYGHSAERSIWGFVWLDGWPVLR